MSDDFSRGLVQMSETLLLMAVDFKANATPEQCEQLASLCVEFAAVVKSLAPMVGAEGGAGPVQVPSPVASAEPEAGAAADSAPARASIYEDDPPYPAPDGMWWDVERGRWVLRGGERQTP